jgi:hypothetical protein
MPLDAGFDLQVLVKPNALVCGVTITRSAFTLAQETCYAQVR